MAFKIYINFHLYDCRLVFLIGDGFKLYINNSWNKLFEACHIDIELYYRGLYESGDAVMNSGDGEFYRDDFKLY